MLCPKCNSKLKCFNSRQIDNISRFREYACNNCGVTYISNEKLEKTVGRKLEEIPTRAKRKRKIK
jgi:hypothetical protein